MPTRRQLWLTASRLLALLTGMTLMRGLSFAKLSPGQMIRTRQDAVANEPAGQILRRRTPGRRGVSYYLVLPSRPLTSGRPFVAIHGISRNAREHAATFQPLAERLGRAVIAPVYTKSQAPRYQRLAADSVRADDALLAVIDDAQTVINLTIDKIDLFGFSGGAQFAHRFAMIHPDRVASLSLSSAGWYTMPTMNEPFPYGIGSNNRRGRIIQVNLQRFLAMPMLVLVGEKDVKRDAGLRKSKSLDKAQGRNRLERATRWTRAIRETARRWEVRPDVTFRVLSGCGHSFADCVEHGELVSTIEAWLHKRQ